MAPSKKAAVPQASAQDISTAATLKAQAVSNFLRFIYAFEAEKGQLSTHTLYAGKDDNGYNGQEFHGGSYAIPDSLLPQFNSLYGAVLSCGLTGCYIESKRGLDKGPFVLDFDLYQNTPGRQYTEAGAHNVPGRAGLLRLGSIAKSLDTSAGEGTPYHEEAG